MQPEDTGDRAQDELQIEAIVISDSPNLPVRAERFLSELSDLDWAEFREKATRTGNSDEPFLRCADCGHSVYARESPRGRRHCYHRGTEIRNCRWSDARARNFRSIDAQKFRGNQEGERHKALKHMIAEISKLDAHAAAAGVIEERYTKGLDGEYAYPDVYCHDWLDAPIAFEIQLSTTQLPTITRREDFYAANKIRLCWIVGREDKRLEQRSFKDIYLRNDGQIFGVDGEVLAAARETGAPKFRLYRLLPGPVSSGFSPVWKDRIVGADEIAWGNAQILPRSARGSYDAILDERIARDISLKLDQAAFYDALIDDTPEAAEKVWNRVAAVVGGCRWDWLGDPGDAQRSLGVLATVRQGYLFVKTKISVSELPHLVCSMLLEPVGRRRWTRAFQALAEKTAPDLLAHQTVEKKCARNRAENGGAGWIDQEIGPVFDVFFPEGAFRRLRRNLDS